MLATGFFNVPDPQNEAVLSYAPGTRERDELKKQIREYRENQIEIPMFIGGREVTTGDLVEIHPPHDHQHLLGYYHQGGEREVGMAIDAALKARETWASLPWEERASVFLKAADLLSTRFRQTLNAATMLGQSKNVYQAEIDSACELIDFFRFNVRYAQEIFSNQPEHQGEGTWNRLEYRPLEGFVFAVTPFNFTSICGNLPTAPAIMGNAVLWKPASSACRMPSPIPPTKFADG